MKQLIFTLLVLTSLNANAQCNPQATITDDFESYTAGTGAGLPTCWQSKGSTGPVIGIRNSAGAGLSGTNYISIYTFFTLNATTYIISPELSSIDGNHFADFYVNTENADVTFEYGTMSDPNNTATFITTTSAPLVVNTYTHITTAGIPQNTGHVYFVMKFTSPSMHSSIKIDDFSWSALTLPCSSVQNLAVSGITQNTAVLSWNPVSNAQSYKIEYGVDGFTQGTGTSLISQTNGINLPGLQAGKVYDVYVTTNCSNGQTSTSATEISFTTTAASTAGIESIETSDYVIYPNPANQTVNIRFAENVQENEIQIFNLLGQQVFSEKTEGKVNSIDISGWERGIYMILVSSPASKTTTRLVVE